MMSDTPKSSLTSSVLIRIRLDVCWHYPSPLSDLNWSVLVLTARWDLAYITVERIRSVFDRNLVTLSEFDQSLVDFA